MKTRYYYYADENFWRFDTPQDIKPKFMLTESMVRKVFDDCSCGYPPFELRVPSQLLHNPFEWLKPNHLYRVRLVHNRPPPDFTPFDTAVIQFEDSEVLITARRMCVALPQTFNCS